MKATAAQIGEWAERFACRRLQDMGFTILRRNYRYEYCEVDIIARKENALSFVEVKFRGLNKLAPPECFVSYGQRRRIVKAAMAYMTQENLWDLQPQFDVISITLEMIDGRKVVQWDYLDSAFDTTGMGL